MQDPSRQIVVVWLRNLKWFFFPLFGSNKISEKLVLSHQVMLGLPYVRCCYSVTPLLPVTASFVHNVTNDMTAAICRWCFCLLHLVN